jgi:hypothetical protein
MSNPNYGTRFASAAVCSWSTLITGAGRRVYYFWNVLEHMKLCLSQYTILKLPTHRSEIVCNGTLTSRDMLISCVRRIVHLSFHVKLIWDAFRHSHYHLTTGLRTKRSSIWFSINYSTMQWTMFCNMVTLNNRSWRLVVTLPERASVALFLLMR